MNYDKHKAQFERDGYVVVRQFLPDDEFAQLRDNLDRYVREVVPALPDADAFYQDRDDPETLKQLQHIEQRDSFFSGYRTSPRWVALAEALLGETAEANGPEWFNKPPGTEHATPPHQDNYFFCLSPPNVVTLWLALDDVDEENGCLRYVTGSRHHGIRAHGPTSVLGFSQGITDYGPDDARLEAAVSLQAGDLVAHHGETIHRADANRSSTRQRRAFAMVFRGVSCRRDETAFARYTESLRLQHQRMGLETA